MPNSITDVIITKVDFNDLTNKNNEVHKETKQQYALGN